MVGWQRGRVFTSPYVLKLLNANFSSGLSKATVPASPGQVAGVNRAKEMAGIDAWALKYGNMGTYSGKPGKPLV